MRTDAIGLLEILKCRLAIILRQVDHALNPNTVKGVRVVLKNLFVKVLYFGQEVLILLRIAGVGCQINLRELGFRISIFGLEVDGPTKKLNRLAISSRILISTVDQIQTLTIVRFSTRFILCDRFLIQNGSFFELLFIVVAIAGCDELLGTLRASSR